jgi:hypothetical protein
MFKWQHEWQNGALIGAALGFLHGILLIYYWSLNLPWNTDIIATPVLMTMLGAILGVIFVELKRGIPGRSIIRKSLVFSIPLTGIAIIDLILGLTNPAPSNQLSLYLLETIEYPAFGLLFGYLFQENRTGNRNAA